MDTCEAKHTTVVNIILCFKCKVASKDLQGKFPLMLACEDQGSLELVKKLAGAGADVGMSSVDGRTALHEAAMKSELAVVEFLVQQGVDLGAFTIRGETALDLAHMWKNHSVETFLAGFEDLAQQELNSPQP